MVSISKTPKLSEDLNVKKCEDRISKLPCDLISHILSFLPTKFAVATCVLSTKWKQSWTLINSLDFDDMLLLNPEKSDRTPSLQTSFTSFVFRVLLLRRVSCLSKFHLKCGRSYDFSYVSAWVAAALLSNVQELHLSVRLKQSTILPQDLFSCGTLVVLKLDSSFVVNVPTSVCLPNLKILHLHTVTFLDDDSINRLICGCPVLEELSMRVCLGNDVRSVTILAPVLTRLVIYFLNTYEVDVFKYKIVLDTPALLYLEIREWVAASYTVKPLCHLVKAHIDIGHEYIRPNDYSEGIGDLLRGILNVQSLYLSHEFIEAIRSPDCKMPKFHSLTHLEIGGGGAYVDDGGVLWAMLPKLLQNSPRLGTLVFDMDGSFAPPSQQYPRRLPSCFLFHLKEIEIRGFEGSMEDLSLVEHFLSNAKVLEKVTLRYANSGKEWTIRNTK